MAISIGPISLDFVTKLGGFITGVDKAGKRVRTLSTNLRDASTRMVTAGRAAVAFGASLSAAFAPAVIEAAKFDKAMAGVAAVTEGAVDNAGKLTGSYKNLEAEIRRVAVTTRFTSEEAAKAAFSLGLAGLNAEENANAVNRVVRLAAAGNLELARAAEIAADAMNAFGIDASNAARVTDTLAVVATNANTTINQLGFALSFASPAAAALSISIEETSAALGALANQGIKGSTAGTGLARVMTKLAKQTDKAKEIFASYGLQIEDLDPTTNNLTDIINRLGDAQVSVSDIMKVFDLRGGRLVLGLLNQRDTFNELINKTNDAGGAVLRISDIMQRNLLDVIRILVSNVKDLFIEIVGGTESIDDQGDAVQTLARSFKEYSVRLIELIQQTKEFVTNNRDLVNNFATIIAKVAAFSAIFGGAIAGIGLAGQALSFVVKGIEFLVTSIQAIAGVISAEGAAIAAVVLAVLLPVVNAVRKRWDELARLSGELFAVVGRALKSFVGGFGNTFGNFMELATDLAGVLVEGIIWLMEELIRLEPIITDVSYALGQVAGVISGVVVVIGGLIAAIASIPTWILASLVGTLNNLAGHANGLAVVTDNAAAARAALAGLGASLDELADKYLRANDAATKNFSQLGRLNDLMSGPKTPKTMKEMADLLEELGGNLHEAGKGYERHRVILKEYEQEQLLVIESTKAILQAHKREREELAAKGQSTVAVDKKIAELTGKLTVFNQELGITQQSIKDSVAMEKAFTETVAEHGNEVGRSTAAMRANAKELERRQAILDAGREATAELADQEKEFRKLQDKLREKEVDGLAGELRQIKEFRKEQRELIDARLDLIDSIKAEIQLRKIKLAETKAEIQFKKAEAEALIKTIEATEVSIDRTKKLRAAKAALETIEKSLRSNMEQSVNAENDANDALNDQLEAQNALREINRQQIEDTKKAIDDLVQARKEEHLAAQAADADIRGDVIEKARFEAQAIALAAQKRAKALLDDAKAARAAGNEAAARDFERQAQDTIDFARRKAEKGQREAQQDVFGAREKAVEGAERERAVEEDITKQLIKQVTTLQGYFALVQAIAYVREMKERRAVMAARQSLAYQQRAIMLSHKAGQPGATPAMKRKAQEAQLDAKLASALAGKRAGEAGLDGLASEELAAAKQEIVDTLNDLEGAIAAARDKVKVALEGLTEPWKVAAISWIDAAISGIIQKCPELLKHVQHCVDRAKAILDPNFVNDAGFATIDMPLPGDAPDDTDSPLPGIGALANLPTMGEEKGTSMMDALAQAIRDGIPSVMIAMDNLIAQISAKLDGLGQNGKPKLNLGASIQNKVQAGGAGAFGPNAATGTLNDNRSMEMNVNNNMDLAEVERHVGNAMGEAFSATGTV